jgi:outer membrane protein TolC
MDANLRLADINVSKSWVNFKPRVNLAFQYGWEKNNTLRLDGIRPWVFSLSVSLPIFNGFGDYTNLQRAEAEYDRTKEQVESFRRGLLLLATNAQLKVKSTKKRIDIAKIGLQQGLDVLNSVSRRYDAGAASNVDLIDAQTAYTSAKTNYITAVYDNYIAEVELARATGTISC